MTARPNRFASAGLWSLGCVLVLLGAQWVSDTAGGWRFDRAAYQGGAWWQLLSAQWVHLSWLHAGVNAVCLVALLRAFADLVDGRLQALALAGGGAGVALVLALDPQCATYAGASGALHGLLAGSALGLGLTHQPQGRRATALRLLAAAVLAGLALKLGLQHPVVGSTSSPGWLGFASYTPAHEAGALGGGVAVLLARWGRLPWFSQITGR
jgi:rhomboid family GlyGly-CTERM serine protease